MQTAVRQCSVSQCWVPMDQLETSNQHHKLPSFSSCNHQVLFFLWSRNLCLLYMGLLEDFARNKKNPHRKQGLVNSVLCKQVAKNWSSCQERILAFAVVDWESETEVNRILTSRVYILLKNIIDFWAS